MQKLASLAIAATLVGAALVPSAANAASSFSIQYGQQDRFIGDRCDNHPNWQGCDDWKHNRSHWSKSDYNNWYKWNRPSLGNVGAGIFGFVIGSAIASSINNNNDNRYDRGYNSHVAACEARFKSYNAETDMYLGFDGRHHECTL